MTKTSSGYTRTLADLTEAVKLRPGDSRTLNAIAPGEIAACSDANFRKAYVAWFEQAFAGAKASTEANRDATSISLCLSERVGVRPYGEFIANPSSPSLLPEGEVRNVHSGSCIQLSEVWRS